MIPVLFFRLSPLLFISLTLWIPPSRRLTVICTRVPRYYSYFMSHLHRRILQSTQIERFRSRFFRIPLLLRARLRTPHDNLSHSLHEMSLQQISMHLLWWKREWHVYSMEVAGCPFYSNGNGNYINRTNRYVLCKGFKLRSLYVWESVMGIEKSSSLSHSVSKLSNFKHFLGFAKSMFQSVLASRLPNLKVFCVSWMCL